MWLVNIKAFGNHFPGDLVMVPDDVLFDYLYYREAEVEFDDKRGAVLAAIVPIVSEDKE
jgi:hypothetical protein